MGPPSSSEDFEEHTCAPTEAAAVRTFSPPKKKENNLNSVSNAVLHWSEILGAVSIVVYWH